MSNVRERGITLYLAMIALSATLGTALFVSTIYVRELKISRGLAESMQAVYIADSAAEYTLHHTRKMGEYDLSTGMLTLSNGSTLSVGASRTVIMPTASCSAALGMVSTSALCNIEAEGQLVSINSIPGCSSPDAQNCTYVITKGTFGNSHRAMEIIYPNL